MGGVPAKFIESIEHYEKKHEQDFEHIRKYESWKKRQYLEEKYGGNKT